MSTMSDGSVLSQGQLVAIALIPKLTSFLSILAQVWVVASFSYSPKKRNSTYHRLLAGLGVVSLIRALGFFFSTWPIPQDYPNSAWNVGTQATCNVQGFVLQFGLASPIYMAMIALYYWLTIRFGWSESQIRENLEVWFHVVPWLGGVVTALIGLVVDLFQPADLYCWISVDNGWYRLFLYYGPLWICFGLILGFFGSMYFGIREEEIKTLRYRHPQLFFTSETTTTTPPPPHQHCEEQPQQQSQNSSTDVSKICKDNEAGSSSSILTPSSSSPASSSKSGFKLQGRRASIRRLVRTLSVLNTSATDVSGALSQTSNKSNNSARQVIVQIWKQNPQTHLLTMQVSSQVLWYVMVFCVAHFWGSLYRLLQSVNVEPFGVLLVMAILDPLQGFLDFGVYRRPIFLRMRKQHPQDPLWQSAWKTIQWPGIENALKKKKQPLQEQQQLQYPREQLQDTMATTTTTTIPPPSSFSVLPPHLTTQSTDDTATSSTEGPPTSSMRRHSYTKFGVKIGGSDPFGALDSDSDSNASNSGEFRMHPSEEQRLFVQTQQRMLCIGGRMETINELRQSDSSKQGSISSSRLSSSSHLRGSGNSASTASQGGDVNSSFTSTSSNRSSGRRKSSLPKIHEDLEISSEMEAYMSNNETELDACLDRDRMLERLSDLDIIEEVQQWVSVDVKQQVIRRQQSMPFMRHRPYAATASNRNNAIMLNSTPVRNSDPTPIVGSPSMTQGKQPQVNDDNNMAPEKELQSGEFFLVPPVFKPNKTI